MEANTAMASGAVASSDKSCKLATMAQDYYDTDEVINYYRQARGEEHLRVGLYTKLQGEDAKLEGIPKVIRANILATDEVLSKCFPGGDGDPAPDACTMMDMGAGYGGTARVAAKKFGCKVVCINIAKKQNVLNAAMNKAAGLEDKIIIPGEISFFDTGMPDSSFDVVISQDSMLHAGSGRPRAIAEAARVLKPGGKMVLTDYIQAEDAEAADLQTAYDTLSLESLSTLTSYQQWGKDCGLVVVESTDLSKNLEIHHAMQYEVLASERNNLTDVGEQFIDDMLKGFLAWKSANDRGLLGWGFLVLQKPVGKPK